MTVALLLAIGGLAIVDSFNPATIVAVVLILIGGQRRPVASSLVFVAGAMLSVFALGALLFVGVGFAADAVSGFSVWLRRIAFAAAAVALAVAAVRRLRERPRRPIGLPAWFSVGTAFPLGILMTGADLPNAFPYFIAIERLIDADVSPSVGLLIIGAYSLVYCLPCLVLLGVGIAYRDRVRAALTRLQGRFTTGVVPRSVPVSLGLFAAAAGVATIAAWP